MKKLVILIIALLTAVWSIARANPYPDEYLGLPGDNLNLYAVMKIFQESETLEGFESNLNDKNTMINNLDLNGDGMVDYITVHDYVDGSVHTIVLRTALNRNATQDLAVFTVQQFRDGSVQIQLIGDEALYGRNYIIEPIYDATPNPGYTGASAGANRVRVASPAVVEISAWPVIRFIYHPRYVVWRSSWYWNHYPTYWNPWRAHYWHYYSGYHANWYPHYRGHYRHWHQPRHIHIHNHYVTSIRTYAPQVKVRISEGRYKETYSRPELKREGAALYARTRSDRSSATSTTRSSVSERSPATRAATTTSSRTSRSTEVKSGRATTTPSARSTNSNSVRGSSATSARGTTGSRVRSSAATSARSSVNKSAEAPNTRQRAVTTTRPVTTKATAPRTTATRPAQVNTPAPRTQASQPVRPSVSVKRSVTTKSAPAPATGRSTVTKPLRSSTPSARSAVTKSARTSGSSSRPAAVSSSRTVSKSPSVKSSAPARSSRAATPNRSSRGASSSGASRR